MAKQLVNPIERHVEKAVLGLTGLALVAVIALYLVTSPNQIELGQEKVSPSTIDAKVKQKADDVVARLRAAEPKKSDLKPLFDEFARSLQPLGLTPLAAAVAMGPEVPIVDPIGVKMGQAGLVRVNRPAKLTTTHGRSTITDSSGGQSRDVPVDWVTVSALFEVKAQTELQRLEYGATRDEVIFAPPEIQRRARRLDGSWSDEDWKDVKCRPAAAVPPAPRITLLSGGGSGAPALADKDELKALEKFADDLQHPKMQLDVLRPMPPDMVRPTRWALPVMPNYSYRDVLKQDDEYLNPNEPPAADPLDRYGLSGETGRKKEAAGLTPLQEAQKFLDTAKQNKSENDAVKAFNIAQEIVVGTIPASSADKDKAKKIKDDAEQAQRDIIRALRTGAPAQPRPGQTTTQPEVKKQREKLPVQQIWAHDAGVGSIVNGETYQYRLRFRIYNRLAGLPEKFNKPEDAATIVIASEWSDPSDPVWIESSTKFFVTSDNKKDEEIGVEFFQWFGGVWVKPERRIKGTVGALLRDKQRVPTPAIDDPNKVDRPEVEFLADATAIDIDFDRAFRERKAGTTPKGVKFAQPASSCSVVFVDSHGRLQERFESLDKIHPDKKDITGRLWVQPKPK